MRNDTATQTMRTKRLRQLADEAAPLLQAAKEDSSYRRTELSQAQAHLRIQQQEARRRADALVEHDAEIKRVALYAAEVVNTAISTAAEAKASATRTEGELNRARRAHDATRAVLAQLVSQRIEAAYNAQLVQAKTEEERRHVVERKVALEEELDAKRRETAAEVAATTERINADHAAAMEAGRLKAEAEARDTARRMKAEYAMQALAARRIADEEMEAEEERLIAARSYSDPAPLCSPQMPDWRPRPLPFAHSARPSLRVCAHTPRSRPLLLLSLLSPTRPTLLSP